MIPKLQTVLFLSLAFTTDPALALTWDDAGATNNWNTIDLNWNPGSVAWTNGSDAEFSGGGETITLTEAITAGLVTFSSAGYIIDSNNFNSNWGTFAGTGGFTKTGLGTLTLSNASTASGAVNINGGKITLADNSALGTASITLNGGTIERNAPGQTVTNAVAIGATGGTILGRQVVDDYALFSGQLTGTGALTIQGLVNLNNTSNTYSGAITISSASSTYLRLSASEVLGDATTINLGGANARLRLDGGVTETIAALSGSGDIFVSKTGTVLPGTLKFGSDNASNSYTGSLNNGDGQLFLVKQGTGTLTLAPMNSNYTGLTISNGTVLSTNVNGGAGPTVTLGDADTGSGNVAFLTTNSGASRSIIVSANGSGTATIGSTTGAGTGNVVISSPITMNRATTITAASTDRTTFSGKFTGNVGTLTFTGGQRSVIDNTTHDYVGDIVVTGTNTVLQTGVGSGSEHLPNGSSVNLGPGTFLKLAGVVNTTETINALNGSGTVRRHEGVTGLVTLVIGAANGTGSFTGVMENGAGTLALEKVGTGIQTLSGNSSHNGGVTVTAGTVVTNGNNSLGTGGNVTMNSASTGTNHTSLFAQTAATGDLVLSRTITVANQGSGVTTIGTNRTGAGRTFFDGAITINKDVTLSSMLTDRTQFRGGISGTGNVTITGGSRTTFSDTTGATEGGEGVALYNFAGNVTITGAGSLAQFNSDIEFTNVPTVTVNTGATLRSAYAKTIRINSLAGSGTVESVAGSGTLVVGINNGNGAFSGVLQGGGGDALKLTKEGSGTQILSGASTYSGATLVSAGTLLINNTTGSGTGTSAVTVASGATFGGTGSMTGLVTTQSGSFLSPGASIESLTVGSVTGSGTLLFEYDGAAGAPIDQLFVTGSFDITSLTLSFTQTGSSLTNPAYVFASYGSLAGSAFGSVTSIPSGYELDYNYQSANQIALVAVPEPSISVTLLAVCGGMIFRRRRSA